MTVGLLYVGLLIVGVVYAVIAGGLGWLSDLGGGDIHVDAGGHLDAGQMHPISGTIIATFVTGFGGGGTVAHYLFELRLGWSLSVATAAGLLLAAAAFVVLEMIFKQTQAGSEFAVGEMVGREGAVITPIPADGTGEVAYSVKGQRETGPARAIDGSAIAKGRSIVIEKVVGSTMYVREKR
jgi:membrane-bound ClpP family serine protease